MGVRIDAEGKVTGHTVFPTDRSMPGMLYAAIRWADYPHARIVSIDTTAARALEGVEAVLTHADVPGLNRCGRVIPDQPVLCEDRVRFVGDAVACVAARTREIASLACRLIRVEYEELPVVDDPEAAACPGSFRVHEPENLVVHRLLTKGDVAAGRRRADVVVSGVYRTPRQMPGFLETEGGIAYYDTDGVLTVCCGSQAGHANRFQVARALGIPEDRIRLITSPLGGGFGGKDDVTEEIRLALLCQATGKPVKLVRSRAESIRAGIKRHPMTIYMDTGATRQGELVFQDVRIVADTGAYLSLGRSILYLAMEHCTGPYRVPHLKVEGLCVYTNNLLSGACRGFGVNQACFAVESQMDEIAERLGMDPLELRLKNALRPGDEGPLGQSVAGSVGMVACIERLRESPVYTKRHTWNAASTGRVGRGVGVACAFKCVGFGLGLHELGRAIIRILPGGRFAVYVPYEDMGQGSQMAYSIMAAEALGCAQQDVEVTVGDTGLCPDGGPTSASRGTYLGGGAIIDAASSLSRMLSDLGGAGRSCGEKARALGERAVGLTAYGSYSPPKPERGFDGVVGIPHSVFSFMAQAVQVEVDTLTGAVRVPLSHAVVEVGRVISKQGLVGQVEGGTVFGLGMALGEDVVTDKGVPKSYSLSGYTVPYSMDVPRTTVEWIDEASDVGPFGAKGVGELASVPVTAAVVNGIADACGVRVRTLPARPERICKLLLDKG
ncbi:MAG: molybdopterin cofactor-binding domain-containing protein [Bacillota bacterium]